MIRKKQILITISIALVGYIIYCFIMRTNTRLGIEYNIGIEVPASTRNIEFQNFRWPVIGKMDGNGSVVKCEMNKKDLEGFLLEQEWCDHCHGIGSFKAFPDTLIGRYPMENVELRSKVADVLLVSAKETTDSNLEVWFYSDCN
jgi:hypothetical protein